MRNPAKREEQATASGGSGGEGLTRTRSLELPHPNKLGVMFLNQKISPLVKITSPGCCQECPRTDLAAPIFPGEVVFVGFSGRPEVIER